MITRLIANKLLPQHILEATYAYLSGSYACSASCLHTAAQPSALATPSCCSSQLQLFTTTNSSEKQPQTPFHCRQLTSRSFWTTTRVFSAGDAQAKRHAMKCNTAAGTPVSQAVACMVDRDVMPRQQLCAKMDQLSQQLAQDVAAYSSTELSAFSEACRCVVHVMSCLSDSLAVHRQAELCIQSLHTAAHFRKYRRPTPST
jgi:hypothetical protein